LGEFVLKGALSATCPLSSFAAFLYTDNTALCAYAGTRGAYIHSEGYLGLEVISTKSIGISANAPKIAIEALSPMRALSAWGGEIGLDVYSPVRAISAFGGRIAGEFYSPSRALSAYGGQIGLDIYSSTRGISAFGGFVGGEFYSPFRALSAYGKNIGLDAYSSNWGVNSYGNTMGVGAYSNNVALSAYGALTGIKAEGGNVGASFHSPMISLSTGGGGINVFNGRVGIYKVPQPYYPQQASQVVLDVNGDVRIDGNTTITGDLSALGTFSYLDTKVQITSSLVVNNKGTDAATTIIQTGAYPILQCFDQDINDSKASLMVDGAKNGWVGIGVNSPTASFNIVKANTANEANGQPQVRISEDGTTTRVAIATYNSSTAPNRPYIGTETNHSFDLRANGTRYLTVSSNGLVGVGTYDPIYQLDTRVSPTNNLEWISSFVNPVNNAVSTQGAGIKLQLDNPSDSNWYSNKKWVGLAGVAETVYGDSVGLAVYTQGNIGTTPGNAPTEKFRIKGNGNVGVNTTSPTAKLAVLSDSNGTTALSAYGTAFGAIIAGGDTRINYDGGGSTYINTNNTVLTNVNIGNSNANGTNVNVSGYVKINDGNTTASFRDTEINYNGSTGTVRIGNNSAAINAMGAPIGINNNSGTATNTNIGTGTTTGTVSIGNSSGTLTLNGNTASITTASTFTINGTTGRALNINNGTAATTNINTGTGAVTTTIGNAGTIAINGTTTIAGNTTIADTAGNTLVVGNQTGTADLEASTLTITTASTIGVNTTTGRALNINNGTAATTNINTGTGAVTTTIGNAGTVDINGSVAVTIDGPTTINGSAGTNATNIATGTTTGNIQIGNTTGSTTALVGIGTSPSVRLDVSNNATVPVVAAGTVLHITQADTTNNRVLLDSFGVVANARPAFTGRAAGGTAASPSAVLTDAVLCEFTGQGYGTSAYSSTSMGRVTIKAAESWTNAAQGTYIGFETTANGTTTTTEVARLSSSGSLLIGTTSDRAKLTVEGPISTKAAYLPTITGDAYTVLPTDSSLIISNTTVKVTLTLPTASTCSGRWLYIKNVTACQVDSNASNVKPLATNTAGSAILTATAGKFAALQSDGTNWVVMMAN
jgi:hypothetical protein